jgi:hypothetical protein
MEPPSAALVVLRVVHLRVPMAVRVGLVALAEPVAVAAVLLAYMALAIMAWARMAERVTLATQRQVPTAHSTPQ